jgi:hypothetical protein
MKPVLWNCGSAVNRPFTQSVPQCSKKTKLMSRPDIPLELNYRTHSHICIYLCLYTCIHTCPPVGSSKLSPNNGSYWSIKRITWLQQPFIKQYLLPFVFQMKHVNVTAKDIYTVFIANLLTDIHWIWVWVSISDVGTRGDSCTLTIFWYIVHSPSFHSSSSLISPTKYSILHNGISSWSLGSLKCLLKQWDLHSANTRTHIGHVRLFLSNLIPTIQWRGLHYKVTFLLLMSQGLQILHPSNL